MRNSVIFLTLPGKYRGKTSEYDYLLPHPFRSTISHPAIDCKSTDKQRRKINKRGSWEKGKYKFYILLTVHPEAILDFQPKKCVKLVENPQLVNIKLPL
jgi:hypothetical protein